MQIQIIYFVSFQLIDMTPNELQWLSSHMGHDVATHKKNYRLHDNHIELAKVGKLLTAVDSGKAVSGKTLGTLLEGNVDSLIGGYIVLLKYHN